MADAPYPVRDVAWAERKLKEEEDNLTDERTPENDWAVMRAQAQFDLARQEKIQTDPKSTEQQQHEAAERAARAQNRIHQLDREYGQVEGVGMNWMHNFQTKG